MSKHSQWLDSLKCSWETKDFTVLSTILADRLQYFESPFLLPFTHKQEVIDEWKKSLEKQKNIHVDSDILFENTKECFAHWKASFARETTAVTLDGIFHFRLNEKNECTYFKMWWVQKPQ